MLSLSMRAPARALVFSLLVLIAWPCVVVGQISSTIASSQSKPAPEAAHIRSISSAAAAYFDPAQGASSIDLVRRAFISNQELNSARLDIDRARSRVRQAGLLPNPAIDFEQSTGRFTGSNGERSTSVGVALPIELGGKRRRRIDLAQAELAAAEAEIADRERRLAGEIRALYAEALAAIREFEILERLNNIDLETTRIVNVRVKEGDASQLELSLLSVEVDRLKSRLALVEGRLQAALLRLKAVAGIPLDESLRLREDIAAPLLIEPPNSLEEAIEIALRERPDLRLAKLNEAAAMAGLRLAQALSVPDLTVFGKYSFERAIADLPAPLTAIPDRDKILSFGVSVGLPIFNRNQGARAEAAVSISQAQRRREFTEQLVRAEVRAAYARYEAARAAISRFEQGVIARSTDNIRVVREAYNLGEFRVTELLTEQRRLVDSQREYTETLAERYRALADLQSAIGMPVNP